MDKQGKAIIAGINAGIDEQRRQFDLTRTDYAPWMDAGKLAIGQLGDFLGLNGADKTQAAIDAMKASPMYESLYRNGEEALLANASATGGMRGGNMVRGLADFGADTLSDVIDAQIGRLGAVSGSGATMTGNLGSLGQVNAANIAQGLMGIGQARAGIIAGKQNVRNNTADQIQALIMKAVTGGFGGIPGGGGFNGGFGGFGGGRF